MTISNLQKERFDNLKRLHESNGALAYLLEVFGFTLAEREGYKDIDGMEAIHLYLMHKHHWLPRDIKAMSQEDLRLALHVEMQDWNPPPAAR